MALLDKITKIFQTTEPPKVRLNELASSESQFRYKNMITPYNPDTLIGRKGMQIYDTMRIDDMVKSSLSLKKFATLAPNFRIVPASGDRIDEEIADFVNYCIENMKGSMNDSLFQIMSALDYGFSITEINYELFENGKYPNKIGLKNLKTKRPHNYSFLVDRFSMQ